MVLLMLGMLLLMLRLLNEPAEQSPHASSKAQFGSFSVCAALKQFSMSSQSHAFFVTYVNETAFDSCMNKLKNIRKLTQEIIDQLELPDNSNQNMEDGGMMIPVNMPRLRAEFHSVKQMAQQLGVQATVEAFIKGRADFEENKHKLAKQ